MPNHNELTEYLRRRLDYLQQCKAQMENKLTHDKQAIIDMEGVPREVMLKALRSLEEAIGNSFRFMLLIGVCSYLEEATKTLCELVVPSYEKQLKKTKQGNWLKKHLELLASLPTFDSTRIQSKLKGFDDLIVLRNCITHSWGKLKTPNEVKRAMEAVGRLIESTKSQNLLIGGVFKNVLFLQTDIVSHAIWLAEEILDSMLRQILGISIV